MGRQLKEIVRFDRRWFRAHPERRHRCRWPDTGELDLYDGDRGAPLVMAIRHLGRGHVVYQPVLFQGVPPRDERSAAALFALAAKSLDPIPVIAQTDVLRLRRVLWSLGCYERHSIRSRLAETAPAISAKSGGPDERAQ
jgi:hypothetical protein